MLSLEAPQQTVCIDNIEIGGQIGERPPVLIGSIFYSGHRIVKDPSEGVFDTDEAARLLGVEAELSSRYSIPHIIDVIAESETAMAKYIDFVVANSDAPFLVDATNPKVRLTGMRRAAEIGALDRAIYNSIDTHTTPEELGAIADIGCRSAVILAFSMDRLFPKDRIGLLMGDRDRPGLLEMASGAGVENLLIDVGVLDLPSTSWTAQAIFALKNELGLPVGCAPSNALYTWKRQRRIESPYFEACGAAVFGLPLCYGADFILYGPIGNAPWVFPSAAITSAMIAYGARVQGRRPVSKDHPLYRLF